LTFGSAAATKPIAIERKGDSKKEADEPFNLDQFDNSSNSRVTSRASASTT
jgi:hypothetical protein